MTDAVAKLLSLRLLLDWQSRKIWMVKRPRSDSLSDIWWFKSEDVAKRYALAVPGAIVQECITPTTFEFSDDLSEVRRQIVATLDSRLRGMQDVGYTHESARG